LQRRLAGAGPQVHEELEVISRNGLRLGHASQHAAGSGQQPATVRASADIDLANAARFQAALTEAAATSSGSPPT